MMPAQLVKDIVGKGNIEVKQKDKDFPSRGALSIKKAQDDFDYNPEMNLNEGLMIYYHWFLNSKYWQDQFNPKPKEVKVAQQKLLTFLKQK